MAVRHTYVVFGDSLIAGRGSYLTIPVADFSRWTGQVTGPGVYPVDLSVDDVRVLTPKMPSSSAATTEVTAVGTGPGPTSNTTTIVSPAIFTDTATDAGRWVVFTDNGFEGCARRVVSVSATTQAVVAPALTGLADGTTFYLMDDANTVESLDDLVAANCSVESLRFYLHDTETYYHDSKEYPNYYQTPQVSPKIHASNSAVNCIPELTWRLKSSTSGPVYLVSCGIGLATLASYRVNEIGWHLSPTAPQVYSWAGDITSNDFSPSSVYGLYSALQKMIAALAGIEAASGNTISIDGFFLSLGTNDAKSEDRANQFLEGMRSLRKSLREWVSDSGYTSVAAERIPWVMATVGGSDASLAYKSTVNSAINELAEDDPFTNAVDTEGFSYEVDNIHLNNAGSIQLGEEFYNAWLDVRQGEVDATVEDDTLLRLSDLRTAVRRRYERTGLGNASSNTQIDGFINDALREIYNTLGDNPWFLRKVETITATGFYPSTIELPKRIRRPVRFESSAYPGRPLRVKSLYTTDNGSVVVTLPSDVSGPYLVYHTEVPRDLEGDDDRCLVPRDYQELIVILACKRLAECSGNGSIAKYYDGECARLWRWVKQNVKRHRQLDGEQILLDDTSSNYGDWTLPGTPWRI